MAQKPHIVLVIGDEGAVFAPFNVPGMHAPVYVPAGDRKNIALMVALAARYPRIPVSLLADTLGQDLRHETLPRLGLFDRRKLIRRRLQQAFPNASLAAALPGRDRSRVLFAGLQPGGPVHDWIARLSTARQSNPPRTSFLSVECAGILARLLPAASSGWALLMSRQRTGGFRQIVTYNGELVFSRLASSLPAHARPVEVAMAISRDIQATQSYLTRLGFGERSPMRAVLLVPQALQEALHRAALPLHNPLFTSPHDAARKLGMASTPATDDPYGDWVFASWFARNRQPELRLLPADLRQVLRAAITQQWGMRAACLAFLVALALTGWNAGDLVTSVLDRQTEIARLEQLEKLLAREQAAAEPVTEPLGRLRQAIERRRIFNAAVSSPRGLLIALNEGLGANARLTKLEWQNETGEPADEILHIAARLAENAGPAGREMTVVQFQKLAQSLALAMPDYEVTVTRFPFPALPGEALTNIAAGDKTADASTEFLIRRSRP
ncbi:MAG: hypothetical protein AB7H77_04195 [Bdellovibrionales bacterium]